MKKILLILPVVLLLAVGCHSKTSTDTGYNAPTPAAQPVSKVDATVNSLDQSVQAEEQASTESDADIVTSDKDPVINGSEEVSNASQN